MLNEAIQEFSAETVAQFFVAWVSNDVAYEFLDCASVSIQVAFTACQTANLEDIPTSEIITDVTNNFNKIDFNYDSSEHTLWYQYSD